MGHALRSFRSCRLAAVVALLALAAPGAPAWGQGVPAFPGAEGAGGTASGGRYCSVYHVTNLDNSGPGSFRDAISSGDRVVVFDVGGTINLDPNPDQWLRTGASNITVAGQTAPGNGIFIHGQGVKFTGTNVIVRNVHFRPAEDPNGRTADALWLQTGYSIFDHCSAQWHTDEGISMSGGPSPRGENTTVQYCIIAEGLNYGGHSYGALIGVDTPDTVISYHHNLFAHNKSRNPRIGNKTDTVNVTDFRNNVMYNWASNCGYSGDEEGDVNFVGNYYIAGLSTSSGDRDEAFQGGGVRTHIYQSSNKIDDDLDGVFDGTDTGWTMFTGTYSLSPGGTAFAVPSVYTQTADDALQTVLNYAGANWWNRDPSVDARIVGHVLSAGTVGSIINYTSQVGGLTYYPEVHRPAGFDTDNDGMPNDWELAHGLDPNVDDRNGNHDNDQYTNLEEYLNELAAFPAPKPIVWAGGEGRYEMITNWDIPWQPSLYDQVQINSGTAAVDYIGQQAGTLYVGYTAASNGKLAVRTGAGLTVADGLILGNAAGARGTATLGGAVLMVGGSICVGSSGNGVFMQSGGSCRTDSGIVIAQGVGSTGLYELSGGILSTPQLSQGNGTASFHFTGGTLHAGEVSLDLTNQGGLLAPGDSIGQTQVHGNLTLVSGAVEMELASLSNYDQIIVDGLVTLGGVMDVKSLSGYRPREGDEFAVITSSDPNGTYFVGNFSTFTSNITRGLPGSSAFSGSADGSDYELVFLGYTSGDANGDSSVDGGDLALMGGVWMASGQSWATCDFTGDGKVDGGDLALMGGNWMWSLPSPPAAPVPEPASLLLLSAASAAVLIRRNRP